MQLHRARRYGPSCYDILCHIIVYHIMFSITLQHVLQHDIILCYLTSHRTVAYYTCCVAMVRGHVALEWVAHYTLHLALIMHLA